MTIKKQVLTCRSLLTQKKSSTEGGLRHMIKLQTRLTKVDNYKHDAPIKIASWSKTKVDNYKPDQWKLQVGLKEEMIFIHSIIVMLVA